MKNLIVSSRKACFSGRRFYISRPDINESHFKAAGVELKSFPDDLHTKSMFFFRHQNCLYNATYPTRTCQNKIFKQ